MSLITALRLSPSIARQSRCLLLQKKLPVLTSTQHKQFRLAPISRARIYGPEEDHEKIDELHHWKNERYVAVALIPIIPVALIFPSMVTDTLLVTGMVLHTYWRLSGVAEDYIHGQILPNIAQTLVKLITIVALGTLTYFNYFDIGFAKAARKLYTEV